MRILLIEDDECLVSMYRSLLKDHEVTYSINQVEIAQKISDVDIVVSDFHVPGVDFFLTQKLCEMKEKPLILVSGMAEPGLHKVQFQKPFDIDKFLSTLERLCHGQCSA